jgi:hypothetical protein
MRVIPVGRRSPRGVHKDHCARLADTEPCPTCGVVMSEHARCHACGILLGPGHTGAAGGVCFTCRRQSQTEGGALQVKESIRRNGLCG